MTEHAPCEVCDGAMLRRDGEEHRDYLKRRTCKKECRRLLHERVKTRTSILETDHPGCVHCGKPVARHEGEQRARWLKRRTCSPECLLALSRARVLAATTDSRGAQIEKAERRLAEASHPPCVECGGVVHKAPQDSYSNWMNHKTCSPECRGKQRCQERGTYKVSKPAKPSFAARGFARDSGKSRAKPAKNSSPEFETVEQALGRGVKITRVEAPVMAVLGNPVRGKIGWAQKQGRV